jgi:hypothetical protein
MTSVGDSNGKCTYKLESWKKRDKVLAWFKKGSAADHGAKLTFSPDLNKLMRAELHRCGQATLTRATLNRQRPVFTRQAHKWQEGKYARFKHYQTLQVIACGLATS